MTYNIRFAHVEANIIERSLATVLILSDELLQLDDGPEKIACGDKNITG